MCKPVSPTVSKGLLRDCENRWIVCSSSRECDVSRPAADDRSRWAQSETAHSHSRAAQQISDNCCLVHRRLSSDPTRDHRNSVRCLLCCLHSSPTTGGGDSMRPHTGRGRGALRGVVALLCARPPVLLGQQHQQQMTNAFYMER